MNRFVKTFILAIVILVGGWALFHRDQISTLGDAWRLASAQLGIEQQPFSSPFELVKASDFEQGRLNSSGNYIAPSRMLNRPVIDRPNRITAESYLSNQNQSTIQIASFKLDSTSNGGNVKLTADICQQYDVVAIQNESKLSITRLVKELNLRGLDFRFVDQIGANQKFATIFNQQTVVLENQHWYTVNDPEDLFLYEPLVAWFRASNAPPEQAFTFTVANVQLNARQPDKEVSRLGELFRAIRNDGRGEDDIILAGDFCSNDLQLKTLNKDHGLKAAITGTATNTRNDRQLDNVIFDERATIEYAGESGVFDFMKRFNMTLVEAFEISNRMPVWAEFSNFEGHTPGRAVRHVNGPNPDQ